MNIIDAMERFELFLEYVANGLEIREAARAVNVPYLVAQSWWADVCEQLGPQAE